ncbi:MAG: biotin transporter BioY [Hyphomicrobiaceae bacterium]
MTIMTHSRVVGRSPIEKFAIGLSLAIVGSLILAASARMQVPFWPVPMTMQTLAVLVLAMLLGAKVGSGLVLLYVIEGMLGLPVFAGTPERGIGVAYVVGPTGGYLLGFVLAAYVVGWLAERGYAAGWLRAIAAQGLGTAIILASGVAWLGGLIGYEKAIEVGLLPFILSSVAKVILGGLLVVAASRSINRV